MAISQAFIGEFEHEAATTRKCLERIPAEKLTWKPHEKSMMLGQLAGHIADMTSWAQMTMDRDVFDMNPTDGSAAWKSPEINSIPELLAYYDEGVAKAKVSMAAAEDAKWMANWSLANAGHTIMTMPRVAVMRTFIMNHLVHHRAQLTVYLRMLDVPVPSIYGPSADEGQMG
jgi:uncharacterized damage-inducible protein DinB